MEKKASAEKAIRNIRRKTRRRFSSAPRIRRQRMYRGREREIFTRREKIKRLTLQRRKKENLRNAA